MISGKGRISSTDGISTACILDHPRRKDYRTFPVLPREEPYGSAASGWRDCAPLPKERWTPGRTRGRWADFPTAWREFRVTADEETRQEEQGAARVAYAAGDG
jgi:hypothetical protein